MSCICASDWRRQQYWAYMASIFLTLGLSLVQTGDFKIAQWRIHSCAQTFWSCWAEFSYGIYYSFLGAARRAVRSTNRDLYPEQPGAVSKKSPYSISNPTHNLRRRNYAFFNKKLVKNPEVLDIQFFFVRTENCYERVAVYIFHNLL